mgnify:CR=1 FL=1
MYHRSFLFVLLQCDQTWLTRTIKANACKISTFKTPRIQYLTYFNYNFNQSQHWLRPMKQFFNWSSLFRTWKSLVQVNLCQKLLFLHQLTHNMTADCSLNYKFNTWKFQAQTWARTYCVQKLFLTFRTIFVHNMFSPCSEKRKTSDKELPEQFASKTITLLHYAIVT